MAQARVKNGILNMKFKERQIDIWKEIRTLFVFAAIVFIVLLSILQIGHTATKAIFCSVSDISNPDAWQRNCQWQNYILIVDIAQGNY